MADEPAQVRAQDRLLPGRPETIGRVLLLYSGGLDTSVMLHWIQARYGAEIVTLTVDLGQPGEDWDVVVGKAKQLGAIDAIRDDAREEFARDYVLPAIRANALYGGGYPLFTALARPLIAKLAVDHARATGCDTIAHGCTGKGNDQVRIDGTIAALAPEIKVLAPVREWAMGREEEIAYANEHRIPVKGSNEGPPYSIDDNLWGRSSEGREIETLDTPPEEEVFQLVTHPRDAPDEAQRSSSASRQAFPSRSMASSSSLSSSSSGPPRSAAAMESGSSTTSRTASLASRCATSTRFPPPRSCSTAHQDLEKLVSTIHQNEHKHVLDRKWAYLVYAGLWLDPLRHDLDAYMLSANERVTGEITVELYKGSVRVVARRSPYALYDESLASFGESGGEFSQTASPGFIELHTLQSRMAHRIRERQKGKE